MRLNPKVTAFEAVIIFATQTTSCLMDLIISASLYFHSLHAFSWHEKWWWEEPGCCLPSFLHLSVNRNVMWDEPVSRKEMLFHPLLVLPLISIPITHHLLAIILVISFIPYPLILHSLPTPRLSFLFCYNSYHSFAHLFILDLASTFNAYALYSLPLPLSFHVFLSSFFSV